MIFDKLKKLDIVMTVAWILAIVSALLVRPDGKYIDYIDFRSLGILWGLMIIIQGFKKNNLFDMLANKLISKFSKPWQLMAILVFICFFLSMFITNDVALITFVPIAIMILKRANLENVMIPIIVLQTIAANLGSMLTPIGNPQNLYMYGLTGLSLIDFCKIMLPYSVMSFILLVVAIFFVNKRHTGLDKLEKSVDKNLDLEKSVDKDSDLEETTKSEAEKKETSKREVLAFSILFIIALLTVGRIIPYYIFVGIVLVAVLVLDRKLIAKADYILLLTFIGFFIFTGNMGRIPLIKNFLENVMANSEFIISLITSQFISNVPATLMLSGFTTNYRQLIIGVNIGGLGTLIASMASLISYKAYTKEYKENTGKYMKTFTGYNIIFLVILIVTWLIIR
ncbi:SLC13 family permease [Lachnospira multipara]|uniref:Na+/H+ antiporter NhaD n=1 Tax=Lachnospira multipara TaxID=28051 RepID=A0A1H5WFJ1_9FIRM|nr:SLC13 family permease [Lachnospira multipara]SEF98234.1 Na+/H+ antiporter NhaD [Lachnospira multipara]